MLLLNSLPTPPIRVPKLFSPSQIDLTVLMKRSIRLPFSLLLLVAIATVLSCRKVVLRGFSSGSLGDLVLLPSVTNSTLIKLAAIDIAEAEVKKDVDELLDGSLAFGGGSERYRSISLWRESGRAGSERRFPIRLRAPKDFRMFPEFRRSLRDWFRKKRFQPEIMSELIGLVKRPIDRHYGYPDSGRPYSSCAVVGNSGILLNSNHGELIDGHDLVIRLNNARTSGYDRDVGSKTSLSFVNSNILHLCARRESCFCHPYGETVPIIMYICQAVHFLDYTVCNSSHKAPLLITDARFDMLCARIVKYYSLKQFVEETGKHPDEWGKSHDEKMFHYSSGMQAVMLALGICDKVSVFGFGKSKEAKHHYHTNQRAELDLHDYEAEYAFYGDLIMRPQINMQIL